MDNLGKALVLAGLSLALFGGLVWMFGRGKGGWLPGDIFLERGGVKFFFPLATCIVLSLVLTLLAWWIRK